MLGCVLNNSVCSLVIGLIEQPESVMNFMKIGAKIYPIKDGLKEGINPYLYVEGFKIIVSGNIAFFSGKKAISLARQDFYSNRKAIFNYALLSAVGTIAYLYLVHQQAMRLYCQGAIGYGAAMDFGYIPTEVKNSYCGKLLGLSG